MNILADALYAVFTAKYQDLRANCFLYLSCGGDFASGPVSLLSGMSTSQATLLRHFFAVALFGIFTAIKRPTVNAFLRCASMMTDAVTIITPLLFRENLPRFVQ